MDKYILAIFSTVQTRGLHLKLDKVVMSKMKSILKITASAITKNASTISAMEKNIKKTPVYYLADLLIKVGKDMKNPIIPISEVKKLSGKNLSNDAALFLTGVLEYLVAEILELARNSAINRQKKTVIEYDIQLVIFHDSDLSKFFRYIGFPVVDPYSKKSSTKKSSFDDDEEEDRKLEVQRKKALKKSGIRSLKDLPKSPKLQRVRFLGSIYKKTSPKKTVTAKKSPVRKVKKTGTAIATAKKTKKQLTEMTVVAIKKYMDTHGIKPKTGTKAQLISRITSGKKTAKKTTVRKATARKANAKKSKKTTVRKTTVRKTAKKKTKKQLTEMTVVALKKYMDAHGIKPKTGKKAQLINRIIKA